MEIQIVTISFFIFIPFSHFHFYFFFSFSHFLIFISFPIAATFDGDGCFTQNIRSTVVNDYEHFKTSNCISKPEWKATICPLKYANVWFENLNTPGSLKNGLDMTNGNPFGQSNFNFLFFSFFF